MANPWDADPIVGAPAAAPQIAPSAASGSPPVADSNNTDGLPDGTYADAGDGHTFMVASVFKAGGSMPAAANAADVHAALGTQPGAAPSQAPQAPPGMPNASATPWDSDPVVPSAPASPAPTNMGGGDPGTPTTLLGRMGRDLDTGVRQAANFVSGGWADKADAALTALPKFVSGGAPAWTQQYTANLDADKARDAADWREAPGAFVAGAVPGALAQGLAFPEARAAGIAGRLATGAWQGAALGAVNSLGQSRGSLASAVPKMVQDAALGGLTGSALGAVLGPRLASAEFQPPVANLADYDRVGVDPMLAVNGSETAQRVGQILNGTPLAGIPIQQAARKSASQAADAFNRFAAGYGRGVTPEEAGGAITGANQAAQDAVQAGQARAGAAIARVASNAGSRLGRQQIGEDVQSALQRFKGGEGAYTPDGASLPARATSFSDKAGALYDGAFGRLDNEMAEKGGGLTSTGSPGMSETGSSVPLYTKPDTVWKPGYSLMDFIGQNGGLHDQGGEVSAMDGDIWHTDKSHVGNPAFRRKVVNPSGSGLEAMAERAHDAGYFPDVAQPQWSGSDNTQAVSGQDLLDAMRGELAGKKRYAGVGAGPQDAPGGLGPEPGPVPATGSSAPGAAARAGAKQWIRPTATQGVIRDILGRAQSPEVKGLLDAPQVKTISRAVGDAPSLSFNDLRGMRTWVRQAQDNDKLRQTIGDADLQRLEGALTSDIYANADRLGSPQAAQQLRRADQFYAAGQSRISKALNSILRAPSGEAAYDKIISAASNSSGADAAKLQAVRRSLRPAEWREVASGAVSRMGEGKDGFDVDAFVRSYDRLSPAGRATLFGGSDAYHTKALSDLVAKGKAALAQEPARHFADAPAAAFQGLLAAAKVGGTKADVGAIRALREAVPADKWGDVAASALKAFGTKADTDGHFDFSRFSTEWGKLSTDGKQAIFGGAGREKDVAALDSLARISEQMKRASKFYNHSNSGHAGGGIVAGLEGVRALMEGNHHELMGLAAAGTLGAGAAKLMASPGVARLVLRATRAGSVGAQASADAALDDAATKAPEVAKEISAFRANLQKIRANAPGSIGANLAVTMHRQSEQAVP